MDYLLEGESVRANAHLRAFVERHERTLLWRLRWDDNYASWARVNGRKLRKEIAEAMGEMIAEGKLRGWGMCNDNCYGLTVRN